MIAGGLLAGNTLRAIRTHAPAETPDLESAAGSAASASATTPANCITPGQITRQPGTMTSIDGRPAYRFTINDEHRFQPADRPLVVTKQTRVVWVVQSGHPDRAIVAYATPGESALFPASERAISTMTITAPFVSQRPVVLQRDEVLRQWLYDMNGALIRGRRAEARLMTFT